MDVLYHGDTCLSTLLGSNAQDSAKWCIIVGMSGEEFSERIDRLEMSKPAAAERLGISRMTMYRWRRDGVPEDRVKLVELALRYLELVQDVKDVGDG